MDAQTLLATAMALAMMTITVSLFAAEPGVEGVAQKSQPVFGHRVMTPRERN